MLYENTSTRFEHNKNQTVPSSLVFSLACPLFVPRAWGRLSKSRLKNQTIFRWDVYYSSCFVEYSPNQIGSVSLNHFGSRIKHSCVRISATFGDCIVHPNWNYTKFANLSFMVIRVNCAAEQGRSIFNMDLIHNGRWGIPLSYNERQK